jgi:uncharacterized protein YnzC (UPF0291/DUF896 family)
MVFPVTMKLLQEFLTKDHKISKINSYRNAAKSNFLSTHTEEKEATLRALLARYEN